jgi:hypothetical protein
MKSITNRPNGIKIPGNNLESHYHSLKDMRPNNLPSERQNWVDKLIELKSN